MAHSILNPICWAIWQKKKVCSNQHLEMSDILFPKWRNWSNNRIFRLKSLLWKMNCIEFRQADRLIQILGCLGTNMKNYAAGKHWMEHSLYPWLCECLFEIANVLLTVPREVGTLAVSNLTLATTEEVKGSSSTHRKGFHYDDIDAWEDWWAS